MTLVTMAGTAICAMIGTSCSTVRQAYVAPEQEGWQAQVLPEEESMQPLFAIGDCVKLDGARN